MPRRGPLPAPGRAALFACLETALESAAWPGVDDPVTGCDADAYLVAVLLVVLAVGFAFAIGAHYTGVCMGMPHALGAVSAWQALWIMAPRLAWGIC